MSVNQSSSACSFNDLFHLVHVWIYLWDGQQWFWWLKLILVLLNYIFVFVKCYKKDTKKKTFACFQIKLHIWFEQCNCSNQTITFTSKELMLFHFVKESKQVILHLHYKITKELLNCIVNHLKTTFLNHLSLIFSDRFHIVSYAHIMSLLDK